MSLTVSNSVNSVMNWNLITTAKALGKVVLVASAAIFQPQAAASRNLVGYSAPEGVNNLCSKAVSEFFMLKGMLVDHPMDIVVDSVHGEHCLVKNVPFSHPRLVCTEVPEDLDIATEKYLYSEHPNMLIDDADDHLEVCFHAHSTQS